MPYCFYVSLGQIMICLYALTWQFLAFVRAGWTERSW